MDASIRLVGGGRDSSPYLGIRGRNSQCREAEATLLDTDREGCAADGERLDTSARDVRVSSRTKHDAMRASESDARRH